MHSNSGNYVSAYADNVEVVRFNTDSSVDGNTTFDANAFDIAEYYPTQDQTIEGGDVVVLTKNTDVSGDFSTYLIEKSQAANKDQVLGVISTNTGLTMGGVSYR